MPKNNLTLFIFIALVLGVITGYIYNVSVINAINVKINTADANIKIINTKLVLLNDTTAAEHIALRAQKVQQIKISKDNNSIREDKLEGFSILSEIFLRLIKMIVAPLV